MFLTNLFYGMQWITFTPFQYIPACSHFLGCISPWPHLLKRGSVSEVCLLIIWLRKVLNLAQMTRPFPLNVVDALQWRWFSHGFIHSNNISQPFSFDNLVRTFLISEISKTESKHFYYMFHMHWLYHPGISGAYSTYLNNPSSTAYCLYHGY